MREESGGGKEIGKKLLKPPLHNNPTFSDPWGARDIPGAILPITATIASTWVNSL